LPNETVTDGVSLSSLYKSMKWKIKKKEKKKREAIFE